MKFSFVVLLGLFLLQGCSSWQPDVTQRSPAEVQAQIVRLLPSQVADRQGWARDIQVAFSTQEIEPSNENICAVLAVTEQESTFTADPAVAGLARIARTEIDSRAARLHVPQLLVKAALNIESPTGKTYQQRLDSVRTEGQLSAIFDDFTGMVPLGRQLFGSLNPVRTGGPMQVSVDFARNHAESYPYAVDGSIRAEVFTRRGGMYFGIAHLLGYPASYPEPRYRFADFNAGWYASRNAAFQHALTSTSGIDLALDGDLIIHGSSKVSATERAARALGERLDMSERAIRRDLEQGDSHDFESSRLYERVFALADATAGKPLPRAVLPGIVLQSPKITRRLTTAWFAERVDGRYQRCMAKAR